MEARKLNRPNVGECQEIYTRYSINDSVHTGTTTDLCAVIQELEQRLECKNPLETIIMPRELTAKNGAKGLMIGEFYESIISDCPVCLNQDDEIDKDCYLCLGTGVLEQKIMVSWKTIKAIYNKAVQNLGA